MIGAIVLAAGMSRRMGQPKMLMPWGDETVLGHVLSVLQAADLEDIVVITGAAREAVESDITQRRNVRAAFNPNHDRAEMLGSIQVGLGAQRPAARAALVCLGDQPQVLESSVRRVCAAFLEYAAPLVVPSFERRRGHPWLMARPMWAEFSALRPPQTARDFLGLYSAQIRYVELETPTILQDLDTPDDLKPQRQV